MEIICSEDVPIFVLYCFEKIGDRYGVHRSRFGEIFGSSKNHPKGIAISPVPLTRHIGIIKAHYPLINTQKTKRQRGLGQPSFRGQKIKNFSLVSFFVLGSPLGFFFVKNSKRE